MADDGNGIKTDVDMQGAWEMAKSANTPLQLSKETMDFQRTMAAQAAQTPSQIFNGGKIPIGQGKAMGVIS